MKIKFNKSSFSDKSYTKSSKGRVSFSAKSDYQSHGYNQNVNNDYELSMDYSYDGDISYEDFNNQSSTPVVDVESLSAEEKIQYYYQNMSDSQVDVDKFLNIVEQNESNILSYFQNDAATATMDEIYNFILNSDASYFGMADEYAVDPVKFIYEFMNDGIKQDLLTEEQKVIINNLYLTLKGQSLEFALYPDSYSILNNGNFNSNALYEKIVQLLISNDQSVNNLYNSDPDAFYSLIMSENFNADFLSEVDKQVFNNMKSTYNLINEWSVNSYFLSIATANLNQNTYDYYMSYTELNDIDNYQNSTIAYCGYEGYDSFSGAPIGPLQYFDANGNILSNLSEYEECLYFYLNSELTLKNGISERPKNYDYYKTIFSNMTEDELSVMLYLSNNNIGEANNYINYMGDIINARVARANIDAYILEYEAEYNEYLQKLAAAQQLALDDPYSVVTVPKQPELDLLTKLLGRGVQNFGEGWENVFTADGNMSVEQFELSYLMQYVAEKYGAESAMNYFSQAAVSIGNMLPVMIATTAISIVATPAVGATTAMNLSKFGSLFLMGGSIFGNTMEEGLQSGMSSNGAMIYGALSALSESTLQYFLGGITGLSAQSSGFVMDLFDEGLEEGIQEILGTIIYSKMMGEEVVVDWKNVLVAFGLGGFSAGIFNSSNIIIGPITNEILTLEVINRYKGADTTNPDIQFEYLNELKSANGLELLTREDFDRMKAEGYFDNDISLISNSEITTDSAKTVEQEIVEDVVGDVNPTVLQMASAMGCTYEVAEIMYNNSCSWKIANIIYDYSCTLNQAKIISAYGCKLDIAIEIETIMNNYNCKMSVAEIMQRYQCSLEVAGVLDIYKCSISLEDATEIHNIRIKNNCSLELAEIIFRNNSCSLEIANIIYDYNCSYDVALKINEGGSIVDVVVEKYGLTDQHNEVLSRVPVMFVETIAKAMCGKTQIGKDLWLKNFNALSQIEQDSFFEMLSNFAEMSKESNLNPNEFRKNAEILFANNKDIINKLIGVTVDAYGNQVNTYVEFNKYSKDLINVAPKLTGSPFCYKSYLCLGNLLVNSLYINNGFNTNSIADIEIIMQNLFGDQYSDYCVIIDANGNLDQSKMQNFIKSLNNLECRVLYNYNEKVILFSWNQAVLKKWDSLTLEEQIAATKRASEARNSLRSASQSMMVGDSGGLQGNGTEILNKTFEGAILNNFIKNSTGSKAEWFAKTYSNYESLVVNVFTECGLYDVCFSRGYFDASVLTKEHIELLYNKLMESNLNMFVDLLKLTIQGSTKSNGGVNISVGLK